RGCLELDDFHSARIGVEQRREPNLHGSHQSKRAAVTDMIFGRPMTRLLHESPSSLLPHTSPEVVPKTSFSGVPPVLGSATRGAVTRDRDAATIRRHHAFEKLPADPLHLCAAILFRRPSAQPTPFCHSSGGRSWETRYRRHFSACCFRCVSNVVLWRRRPN